MGPVLSNTTSSAFVICCWQSNEMDLVDSPFKVIATSSSIQLEIGNTRTNLCS